MASWHDIFLKLSVVGMFGVPIRLWALQLKGSCCNIFLTFSYGVCTLIFKGFSLQYLTFNIRILVRWNIFYVRNNTALLINEPYILVNDIFGWEYFIVNRILFLVTYVAIKVRYLRLRTNNPKFYIWIAKLSEWCASIRFSLSLVEWSVTYAVEPLIKKP